MGSAFRIDVCDEPVCESQIILDVESRGTALSVLQGKEYSWVGERVFGKGGTGNTG